MASLRFNDVSQPVFANQRRDERVFVFSRRHPIDLLSFGVIVSALIIVPVIVLMLGYSSIGDFPEANGQTIRAMLILGGMLYYGFLVALTMSAWISYYYNAFIVTDERIVEVAQNGLFSREINELTFDQIEDTSTRTRGIMNTFFDASDIEIQSAGSERNFYVNRIPHAEAAVEIINEMAHQARQGISIHERFPQLSNIGLINGHLIQANGEKPKVMNLTADIESSDIKYACGTFKPKNLRERFDFWWWNHCNQMIVTNELKNDHTEVAETHHNEAKNLGAIDRVIEPNRPVVTPPDPRTTPKPEDKIKETDEEIYEIEEVDDDKNN